MRLNAEALQRIGKALGVFPHLPCCVYHALPAHGQQRNGRENIFRNSLLGLLFDFLGNLRCLGSRLSPLELLRLRLQFWHTGDRIDLRLDGSDRCLRVVKLNLVDGDLALLGVDDRHGLLGFCCRLGLAVLGLFLLLGHGRIVHGQVILGNGMLFLVALNALVLYAVDQPFGRLHLGLFFFFLVLRHPGTVFDGADQRVQRDAHTAQHLQGNEDEQDKDTADLGDGGLKKFSQQTGQQSAGGPVLASFIKLRDRQGGVCPRDQFPEDMYDSRDGQQQSRRAEDPQLNRMLLAAKQRDGGIDQNKGQQIAPHLAEKTANEFCNGLEQKGIGVKAAENGKQGQKDAKDTDKFPPVLRFFFPRRDLLFRLRGFFRFSRFHSHELTPLRIDQRQHQHDGSGIPTIISEKIPFFPLKKITEILNGQIARHGGKQHGQQHGQQQGEGKAPVQDCPDQMIKEGHNFKGQGQKIGHPDIVMVTQTPHPADRQRKADGGKARKYGQYPGKADEYHVRQKHAGFVFPSLTAAEAEEQDQTVQNEKQRHVEQTAGFCRHTGKNQRKAHGQQGEKAQSNAADTGTVDPLSPLALFQTGQLQCLHTQGAGFSRKSENDGKDNAQTDGEADIVAAALRQGR